MISMVKTEQMRYGPLRISGICYDSMADGEGVRAAIYFSGCGHNCPGCHNPSTHDFFAGQIVTDQVLDTIVAEINKRPYLSGITLTGGDPMYRPEQLYRALKYILIRVNRPITVWLYTGFLWEDMADMEIIDLIDVVVDGPFDQDLADKRLVYRGSSNQRIIDTKLSRVNESIILYDGLCEY